MIINKSKMLKRLLEITLLVIVLGFIFTRTTIITYALLNHNSPNVIVTINSSGQVENRGDLLGNDLWYPGKAVTGVIRISNGYKTMKINNLGLSVVLTQVKDGVDKEVAYSSFLSNMRLTMSIGRMLVFSDTIMDNKSLSEILYKQGDIRYSGYKLADTDQFTVSKNDSVDLKYTLTMDGQSGNELQDLNATISLLINVDEKVQ